MIPMKRISLAILTLSTLVACSPSYEIAYEVDSCVKEIDTRYAKSGRTPSSIYRVDDIVINEKSKEPEMKVSSWSNSQWYYNGKKNLSYFNDTKLFTYESVDCPRNFGDKYRKKNLGIDKRIKKIDL